MPPDMQPELIPLGFPFFWVGISYVLGVMAGWRSLAETYPDLQGHRDPVFSFQSIQVGWVNYNNVVSISGDSSGIALSVMFLFRAGNPPIRLPWSAFTATRKKQWWADFVVLQVERPRAKIRLSSKTYDAIRKAVGQLAPDPDVAR